jgi:hypothetical protein
MDCTVIGDSIAVGVSQHMKCELMAQVGRATSSQASMMKWVNKDVVVISLGSNDPTSPTLLQDLRSVRARVVAEKVVWLVPYHRGAASAVYRVAEERRDAIVDLRIFPTKDRVHPSDYREVTRDINNDSPAYSADPGRNPKR